MQIGMNGSPLHILTNNKIENKKACFKELGHTGLKDSLIGCAAGATAIGVATNWNTIKGLAQKVKATPFKEVVKKGISKIATAIKNPKQILTTIKDSFKPEKIKALPKPVIAAILGGLTLFGVASAAKSGYIEGKHEEK